MQLIVRRAQLGAEAVRREAIKSEPPVAVCVRVTSSMYLHSTVGDDWQETKERLNESVWRDTGSHSHAQTRLEVGALVVLARGVFVDEIRDC
jgi:hypothetical protein